MDLENMTVRIVEHVAATPESVFSLLSDVERIAGLGPENVAARWITPGRALGAEFVGTNTRDGRIWEMPRRIVGFEPPRLFSWEVGVPELPTARWTYELTPAGNGTDVEQMFAHGPGWSMLRAVSERYPDRTQEFVAQRTAELEANMRAVLQAVADQLRQIS